jgi:hypothetical protein
VAGTNVNPISKNLLTSQFARAVPIAARVSKQESAFGGQPPHLTGFTGEEIVGAHALNRGLNLPTLSAALLRHAARHGPLVPVVPILRILQRDRSKGATGGMPNLLTLT